MSIEIHQVDAFAERAFEGNPAAVCFPPDDADDAWLGRVAAEMNLSETAFLWGEGAAWTLRWLTPAVEVDLCGHATLASAHVIWETGRAPRDATLRFATRSGELTAQMEDGWIALDFPALAPEPAEPPPGLLDALGVSRAAVLRSRFDYLVVLEDAEAVRALQPDIRRLGALPVRGVIVTAREVGDHDFVSRFFAPAAGVDEDPVTGSAHCALAPYWCRILSRSSLTGYQASARGGTVRVELAGDRVRLLGQAVTVLCGELLV